MNIYEFFFVIQFLAFLAGTLGRVYNLTLFGTLYRLPFSIMMIVGQMIFFFSGLVIVMLDYTTPYFAVMHQLEGWLLLFNFMMLSAEVFIGWGYYIRVDRKSEPFNALKAREEKRWGR